MLCLSQLAGGFMQQASITRDAVNAMVPGNEKTPVKTGVW
jgi:hypothetical protein